MAPFPQLHHSILRTGMVPVWHDKWTCRPNVDIEGRAICNGGQHEHRRQSNMHLEALHEWTPMI